MCSPGFGGVGTGGDRKLKRMVLVVAKKAMKPRSSDEVKSPYHT